MGLFRSLRFKLTAGFGLVSLLGVLLFASLQQNLTIRIFRSYLDQSRISNIAALAVQHYRRHGTWDDIDKSLPPPLPPLVGERSDGPDRPLLANARDALSIPGGPPGLRIAILDADNRVVLPMTGMGIGETIDPSLFRLQRRLMLDGYFVGTVLRDANPARLSPEERAFVISSSRTLIGTGITSFLLALGLGVLVAGGLSAPLRRLTRASQNLAKGNFGQQVKVQSQDEVGQLTKAFNRMSTDLAEADSRRRQMVADIAHDLGTPLTVASGYIQALRDNKLQPSQERFKIIHDELSLMRSLIDDLRLLSLADSGQLKLAKEEISAEVLLRNIYNAFQHRAGKQGVEVKIEVEPGLPNLILDSERMRQVLGNLVNNSLNYTEKGEVHLVARRDGGAVEFKVSDTGKGIPSEKLPHIFERFYRADESRSSENGGGSGLGLAIAKSIVEMHGGSISAQSALGQGTTIRVRIPV